MAFITSIQAQYYAEDPYFNGQFKVTEYNLTVTLTKSFEVPLLDKKDETGKTILPAEKTFSNSFTDSSGKEIYQSKKQINKSKYGNVELLNDLKNQGVISSITGWSLVYLSDNSFMSYYDESWYNANPITPEPIYGVYLKRKTSTGFVLKNVSEYLHLGNSPVNPPPTVDPPPMTLNPSPFIVSPFSYSSNSGMAGYVDAYNYIESNNYETQIYTYKENSTTLEPISISISLSGGMPFYLSGLGSTTSVWDGPNQSYKNTLSATGLIGYGYNGEGEGNTYIMDGTAATAFAAFGNASTYQDAIDTGYME
jgi:hypothetical protein